MKLGEIIETIILSRTSGKLGEYLGSTAATFGACRIDGVVYKVKRFIEAESSSYWEVLNVNTGRVAYCKNESDLSALEVI